MRAASRTEIDRADRSVGLFVAASIACLSVLIFSAETAAGFPAAQADTLRLDEVRAAASRQDPRAVQPALITRASRLRLRALRSQRLPQLSLSAQATVQNDVPVIPFDLPDVDTPGPPHEQYRAHLEADWTLYDSGRVGRQAAAERARHAEEVAGAAVTLYAIREAATETFFAALLAGARARSLALAAGDLEVRLAQARIRSKAGAALAVEAAMLEAELIRLRQQVDEAEADRRASLEVLADLTGRSVGPSDVLALPDLDEEVDRVLVLQDAGLAADGDESRVREADTPSQRPELVRLARIAQRAEAEARALESRTVPTLSVFGQAGIGRPSPINFLSDEVSEYGMAGIRLRWSFFDWGRSRREADALRVESRRAEAEAEAFLRQIGREIEDDRAKFERLSDALVEDERAVALREEILRVTHRQLEEGVLLPDTYTDRVSDLAEARLTLQRHRIERARAQARLLSTLGRFPEPGLISSGEDEGTPFVEP